MSARDIFHLHLANDCISSGLFVPHYTTIRFDGAGYSLTETKEVLTSIASDVLVADGDCVNAVEVFWTPSDREEVLTNMDIIADFPTLVTL